MVVAWFIIYPDGFIDYTPSTKFVLTGTARPHMTDHAVRAMVGWEEGTTVEGWLELTEGVLYAKSGTETLK